jgi:glycosyltransferase involved in cell wall biosynthesis
MHIAVNAHLLSPKSGYRQAGVSGYVQHLLRHMLRLQTQNRWSIYAAPGTSPNLIGSDGVNVRWRTSRLPTNSPSARIVWEQVVAPFRTAIDRPDILFCPVNVIPLLAPCPTVVTVHDLAFLRFNLHRPSKRKYLSAMTRLSVRRAAHVITVSEFTRNEVINLLGANPQKVTAISNGIDERFVALDPAVIENFRVEKALPSRFLLFVGTLEPRKNIPTLIRAFEAAKEKLGMPLLVVGGKGWHFEGIFKLV